MLSDNIEIKTSEGEYKDFPYKKELYLYGKCVWTDDYHTDVNRETVIKDFIKALKEAL